MSNFTIYTIGQTIFNLLVLLYFYYNGRVMRLMEKDLYLNGFELKHIVRQHEDWLKLHERGLNSLSMRVPCKCQEK